MIIRFYAYNPNNFKDKYLIVNDNNFELLSSAGFIDRLFEDFESSEKEVLYRRPIAISMDLVRQGDSKLFDAIMFLIDNFDDPVAGPSLVYEIIERLGLPLAAAVETRPVEAGLAQVETE